GSGPRRNHRARTFPAFRLRGGWFSMPPEQSRNARHCQAVPRSRRSTARAYGCCAGRGQRLPCPGATMAADCAQRRLQIGERPMNPLVAVIAPGMMGAAVGKRLTDHGLKVLTSLKGRSAETSARAKAAGMVAASDEEIAATDFILSILPPGDAVALAQRFAGALTASNSKPVYVDCSAGSRRTVERIAAAIAPTGSPFVDAGIIGAPPKPNDAGPRFYASGPHAPRFAALKDFGLDVRVLSGPMNAASAVKMSYAGITKGTQAL